MTVRVPLRRTVVAAAGLACLSLTASPTAGALVAAGDAPVAAKVGPTNDAGPPYEFKTEILTNDVVPLVDSGALTVTDHGYLYRSGKHDNRITITEVEDGVQYLDPTTKKWAKLAAVCTRLDVAQGIGAVCPIPDGVSVDEPLLLETWPRLGHDYVDAHTLSARFAVTVLGDAGDEVIRLGAGPDFVNGAFGVDKVWGGAGSDWIRGGDHDDLIFGGAGDEYVVAQAGRDRVYGGPGDDRVDSGDGDDVVFVGLGRDTARCGTGSDDANAETQDTVKDCEHVARQ